MNMDELLRIMIERDSSDLHIKVGVPPGIRVHGDLLPLENYPPLTPEDTRRLFEEIITDPLKRKMFDEEKELDTSYSVPGLARFRVNVLLQRGVVGMVLRSIPVKIKTLEELKLPKVVRDLADVPRGLVLVTGPTGSGKSTTLAAMINFLNATERLHIVTMEDPIEFVHEDIMSFVTQREVGEDTESFAAALKRVLRQDPDVILVGELRDIVTTGAALTAAETGHVVFGTLHTTSAAQTIDRIIDQFPPEQHNQVQAMLSLALQGVISQTLLKKKDGKGRVLAMEIMVATPAIRNLIREKKIHQIPSQIQTGAQYGMTSLDQRLRELYQQGLISQDVALATASSPEELMRMLKT